MQDCGGTNGKLSYKGNTDSRVCVCMSDDKGLYPVCQGRDICRFTLGLVTKGIIAPGPEEVQGFSLSCILSCFPSKAVKTVSIDILDR